MNVTHENDMIFIRLSKNSKIDKIKVIFIETNEHFNEKVVRQEEITV